MKNKKIIGATSTCYNNIKFRSILEKRVYIKLKELGYSVEYEPDTYTIWEGFYPSKLFYIDGVPNITKTGCTKKILSWEYTPDFRIIKGFTTFYIECKGWGNDLWPYKRKLFLKLLEDIPHTYFFEVKTIKGLISSLKILEEIYEQETNTSRNNE